MIPSPRIRLVAVTAPLAAIVLLAVGCGGDRNRAETMTTAAPAQAAPTTTTSVPVVTANVTDPRRRAYIARVDRICAQMDPERNTARERTGQSADARAAASAYDDSIALGEAQLRRIRAVPVPPRDRDALEANVFGVIRRQLATRRQISAALAAGDLTRLRTLRARLDDLTRSLSGFARGYGFRVCGED